MVLEFLKHMSLKYPVHRKVINEYYQEYYQERFLLAEKSTHNDKPADRDTTGQGMAQDME
jgi:hypothetical protein